MNTSTSTAELEWALLSSVWAFSLSLDSFPRKSKIYIKKTSKNMSCSIRRWKELDICYEREYFNTSTSITFTSFLSPPSRAFLFFFFSIHFSPQSNTSVPNATTSMLHHFWCVKLSDVNFLLLYFFLYISLTNEIQLPSPARLPIPPPPKKKRQRKILFL